MLFTAHCLRSSAASFVPLQLQLVALDASRQSLLHYFHPPAHAKWIQGPLCLD